MTHLEEAKESQSEHGIAAGLPLPIAYAMEIVQDVAQGILEIQRMSVPDITEVSDHEKESPTARFIREIGESNDRILLNSHLSLSEISPYNIPRWVLQDPNIAPFISKRE